MQFDPSTKFPGSKTVPCCIDQITAAGSAFGSTTDGDAVFFNSRIVARVDMTEGDLVDALVLPNYEDKRDTCSFRALRAEVRGSIFDQPVSDMTSEEDDLSPENDEHSPEDDRLETRMTNAWQYGQRILDTLDEIGPMSTSQLARHLDAPSMAIRTACLTLNKMGEVARADVFRNSMQTKASVCVWAVDPSDYMVDPEEN